MVDLSIVIVSYNTCELLAQCLTSLAGVGVGADGRRLTTEVFVVDNASADGSAAMVRRQFPAVNLIVNVENRGFAAANNQAFAKSLGRYVLMLNSDTVVRPGALEALAAFMDEHPRAGVCGGRLVYGDGTLQHSAFAFPTLAQTVLDLFPVNWRLTNSRVNGRYPRSWYARGVPFEIDHPLGADLLVRRAVADAVGWLDEGYFMYCEEIDWCLRIKRAGWQVWCVPQAEIVHYEAQSTRQFRGRMFVELWRARRRLYEKHYGRVFLGLTSLIVRAGLWNRSRLLRQAAAAGRVTQDELDQQLAAFAQAGRIIRGRA